METTIIGHISCSFGVRDVVFCIRIPALIKRYVRILMRTVLICVLDYGPLDSVVHLIVCIMLLWSSFEVGSCLGGSACSVWILVVFLFFGWFCCTCFLFLLVSLLVVAWLAVCVSLCMCLCVCVYVGVFTWILLQLVCLLGFCLSGMLWKGLFAIMCWVVCLFISWASVCLVCC